MMDSLLGCSYFCRNLHRYHSKLDFYFVINFNNYLFSLSMPFSKYFSVMLGIVIPCQEYAQSLCCSFEGYATIYSALGYMIMEGNRYVRSRRNFAT